MTILRAPQPDSRAVTVFVFPTPTIRGLAPWQYLLLFLAVLSGAWALQHKVVVLAALVFSITVAALKFPTALKPLQYVQFLRRRIALRPETSAPQVLPNGVVALNAYGSEKLAVGCQQLSALPRRDDEAVLRISNFISTYGNAFDFVVTTGFPHGTQHGAGSSRTHCLIMVDAGEDRTAQADKLVDALRRAGLVQQEIDPALFEVSAGHNMDSSHFLVEHFPLSMWMGELALMVDRTPCDYTLTVHIAPGDLEKAKELARKIFAPMAVQQMTPFSQPDPAVAAIIRRGARDLLDGNTTPFDVSVDISLCAKQGSDLYFCELFLKESARRAKFQLKAVRVRELPFLSSFRDPPSPYYQTVSQGAAVALCPFFLQDELVQSFSEKRHTGAKWKRFMDWKLTLGGPKL